MSWLTEERLQELKEIMVEEYNLVLNDQEAREFANNYIQVIDMLDKAKAKSSNSVPSAPIDVATRGTIK